MGLNRLAVACSCGIAQGACNRPSVSREGAVPVAGTRHRIPIGQQALRRGDGGRQYRASSSAGRVRRAARPVRLRQDHVPAHDRRLRTAERRRGADRMAATMAGMPPYRRPVNMVFQQLRAVSAFRCRGQRRLRAASRCGRGYRRREIACAVGEALEMVHLGGYRQAQDPRTVRRPAAARGAGPRPGQQAARAAARRAAGGARQEAAHRHADRAAEPAARARHHLPARHPRPGGGAVDERPGLRHECAAASSSLAQPEEIYDDPADLFVADFVGKTNLLSGKDTGTAGRAVGRASGQWHGACRCASGRPRSRASAVLSAAARGASRMRRAGDSAAGCHGHGHAPHLPRLTGGICRRGARASATSGRHRPGS